MKAPSFDYARATSVAEALELLSRHGDGARVIAGGQSLMPALNMRLSAPELLVDIGGVEALKGIRREGEVLTIGALARHAEVERSPLIAEHAPLLAKAVRHVAHAAIRNRGTFGGSIANADPAAEFPACAVALDARMVAEGLGGRRTVAAADFFRGVYETALEPGELLLAVEVPVARPGQRFAFAELARRKGDYAIVGLALAAELSGGVLRQVRPVYFSVGNHPTLAAGAAAALEGTAAGAAELARAQAALDDDLDPPSDLQASGDTRRHLARVLLGRAVNELMGNA